MKNLMDTVERIVYLSAIVLMCLHAIRGNLTMTIASGVIVLSLGLLFFAKHIGTRITINNYKQD